MTGYALLSLAVAKSCLPIIFDSNLTIVLSALTVDAVFLNCFKLPSFLYRLSDSFLV
ncbi:Uncharacterised protein [Proteus mirabilis]|nr:Uncharacterised protein [Klebsiella pneumoniae]SUC21740.1 Uncharacterised protein [Proteus mirabilis]VEB84662.1 Uncharacterised protein [Proteus mirabilis]